MGTQTDTAVMSELSDHGRDSRECGHYASTELASDPPPQPRPADSPAPACPYGASDGLFVTTNLHAETRKVFLA
jgi:hypothetical protein